VDGEYGGFDYDDPGGVGTGCGWAVILGIVLGLVFPAAGGLPLMILVFAWIVINIVYPPSD
jgi:hypothetical protein